MIDSPPPPGRSYGRLVGAQGTWVSAAGFAVPIVAAAIVLTGVLLTLRQKERTDRKDQWWKRVQWSADLVVGADDQRRTRVCFGRDRRAAAGPASAWPHAANTPIQHRDEGARAAHPDETWTRPRSSAPSETDPSLSFNLRPSDLHPG